jgi:ABC-type glycerol-3-phosphate transport system permease component
MVRTTDAITETRSMVRQPAPPPSGRTSTLPNLIRISPVGQQTLPAGLATLQNANAVRYDLLMAGAMIAAVPVLLLYLAAQRFVIEGVSRSGLKG